MANTYFQFKQFKIDQANVAMKVGTDSVILGSWVDPTGKTALDIGTGTGILSLMLTQRNPSLLVKAIEIDQLAYTQALENVENSKWKNNISVELKSFQDFSSTDINFDLIICNPPYFVGSLTSANKQRTLARHTESLPFSALIEGSIKLLNPQGKFCLILPFLEANSFIEKAKVSSLYCNKLLNIYPKEDKAISRIAMEFSFEETEQQTEDLIIEIDRHIYTQKYKDLTGDFYL